MDPKLQAAHLELTKQIMDRPGVNGTAISERDGEPCIVVYLKTRAAGRDIPGSVEGFRVLKEVTGDIRAL